MLYEVIKILKTGIFFLFIALNKEVRGGHWARGLQFRGVVRDVESSSTSTFSQY